MGDRQHVMLSPYYEGDGHRPGARETQNVAIFLDVKELLQAGHLFVCAGNAVVSSWPIRPQFFVMMRWRPTRELIWADSMSEWEFTGMSKDKDPKCPKLVTQKALREIAAVRDLPFLTCPFADCATGVWVGQRWCFGCGRALVYKIPDIPAPSDESPPGAASTARISAASRSADPVVLRPGPGGLAESSAASSSAGPVRLAPRKKGGTTDAGDTDERSDDPWRVRAQKDPECVVRRPTSPQAVRETSSKSRIRRLRRLDPLE